MQIVRHKPFKPIPEHLLSIRETNGKTENMFDVTAVHSKMLSHNVYGYEKQFNKPFRYNE